MTDFFGDTTDINDGVTDQFFEYDWERNLTQAYLDESYSDTHEYDGNGRRMRSKLNSAANWTHFVHDELTEQVLCEFTLVSSTFTLKAANTYGWGLISSNRETVKRYFHFDGLGNTVALTDSSGDVQDSYSYTAFGLPLSSSGSSVNPYRYVGQWGYYDDGAMGSPHDFVLCGVRYYAPRYGRFLTWDPIGERGYGYCDNSAPMAVDPTGRIAIIPVACAVACGACLICAIGSVATCSHCGTDPGCWHDCLGNIVNDLPWWAAGLCNLACAGCFACLGRPYLGRIGPGNGKGRHRISREGQEMFCAQLADRRCSELDPTLGQRYWDCFSIVFYTCVSEAGIPLKASVWSAL